MKRYFTFILAIVLSISLTACGEENDNKNSNETFGQEHLMTDEAVDNTSDTDEQTTGMSKVEKFIEEYNETAANPITETIEFNVKDKDSGHYRTEFRLGAFSNSYAKTGKIKDNSIDIVSYGRNNEDIRIYVDKGSLEQSKEIVETASPILDSNLSNADIQNVLDYLDENQEANGYYYGKIGMTLLGKYKSSYELMLKVE